jgi:hypothetical protein
MAVSGPKQSEWLLTWKLHMRECAVRRKNENGINQKKQEFIHVKFVRAVFPGWRFR